jgi:hypothetical protein
MKTREAAVKIRLPARSSPTLDARRFAYNLSRYFEFETLWRRITARWADNSPPNSNGKGRDAIARDKIAPLFLCPFCECPFVCIRTSTERSADSRAAAHAHVTLRCEARHQVRVQLSQYPDHVEISSEVRAPSLSARRSRVAKWKGAAPAGSG